MTTAYDQATTLRERVAEGQAAAHAEADESANAHAIASRTAANVYYAVYAMVNNPTMKPETKSELARYAQHGIKLGGFLRAFLANDLMEAIGRADNENVRTFMEIAQYVHNELPVACHGSYAAVDAWLAKRDASGD